MGKIIIANWKTNPDTPEKAVKLAREIEKGVRDKKNEVAIAPPMPYLLPVGQALKKIKLAAQDVFWGDLGAYTGEISWHQLKHCEVSYVIVGHSERRRLVGETDEMINKKVLACLKHGLSVILCVGEPKQIRHRGLVLVKKFISNQLEKDLRGIKSSFTSRESLVIAYEPIWAISGSAASHPDKPNDAVEVISYIRTITRKLYRLSPRIIYVGSVNQKNARSFLSQKEINGALVGGASLKPREFLKIIEAAKQ